jgi:hypothetical protein
MKLSESADMSSKSKPTSTKHRSVKKSSSSRAGRMVICILNTGYEVSLEPRKVYEVLRDPDAAKHGQLRVVDESGEDYLYPQSHFAEIVLPRSIRKAVLAAE